MSADNTIYIRPLEDGDFIVAHVVSLHRETCDWDDDKIDNYLEGCRLSKRVATKEEAEGVAFGFEDEVTPLVEYGILEWPRND